jgi:CRP-like cAMP-binding protein
MQKLINSVQSMRRILNEVAIKSVVQICIGLSLDKEELNEVASHAILKSFEAGEELFHEGDDADGLYLIQSGSVTVSRMIAGREVVLFYVAAGNYVGEMSLVSGEPRYATVRAAVATDAVMIKADRMREIIARNPEIRSALDARYLQHLQDQEKREQLETAPSGGSLTSQSTQSNLISFLIQQGVGEATDVLLIDESLCVRCNLCEDACANTHGGASRLDRDTGPIFANIRVPTSCRHCEHPHCMKVARQMRFIAHRMVKFTLMTAVSAAATASRIALTMCSRWLSSMNSRSAVFGKCCLALNPKYRMTRKALKSQ